MSVDLVRIVDSIHRDKNISKDILFEGIQSALTTAARKHYPDAADYRAGSWHWSDGDADGHRGAIGRASPGY